MFWGICIISFYMVSISARTAAYAKKEFYGFVWKSALASFLLGNSPKEPLNSSYSQYKNEIGRV